MAITEKKSKSLVGLTDEEVLISREKNGSNAITLKKRKSFIGHFISNLNDPVIKILLGALILNIIFLWRTGDYIETVGIGISVFLATFISTVSEYGSESAFSRLNEESSNYLCRVRRNGKVTEIPISDVVCDDIVLLSAGDKVPADGFLKKGKLTVDQSAMTGESIEIEKLPNYENGLNPRSKSAILRGSSVISGDGEFLVCVVGDGTFMGQISHEIETETRESPLKIRLTRLASQISRLGYAAAFLVGLAYIFNSLFIDSGMSGEVILMKLRDFSFILETLLGAFTLGLTVIVLAVPEGLPLMISVVLSSNIRRMVKDMVLVRKPVGIEAAGSMNILFTDKTGTLTEGVLSVGEIFTDTEIFDSISHLQQKSPSIFSLYCANAIYNTSAEIENGGAVGGNSTEKALIASLPASHLKKIYSVLKSRPFDSRDKYSSATLNMHGKRTIVKGAPEVLLSKIKFVECEGGTKLFNRREFEKKLYSFTKNGARVILSAYTDGEFSPSSDLTLICGITLSDKIRREARQSVSALRLAGIQIVMITGDSKETARSIAEKCGIISKKQNLCLTSEEISHLSDRELADILPKLALVARALPKDKSRLVKIAQSLELVSGMTGDGINDAPALKLADIGFSMGNGAQVAKEAGDIIILDNNLSSIVKAVLYGRNIFKSIRKFIVLQLTMNLCAVGVSMIGPFIGIDAPVTIIQMLWINIIMDTLGGLAFAGEPPLPSYMNEPPKKRDEPILNAYMINQISFLGVFTVILSLLFLKIPFFTSHFRYAEDGIYLLTAFFAFFIFAGVFNCFNARSDRLRLMSGITKNKPFTFIMASILVIQILFVYLGGSVLRTTPLLSKELFFAFLSALLVFPADIIRKIIWKFIIRKNKY